MKMRVYHNCESAATATNKVIMDCGQVHYFDDNESAADFINNEVKMGRNFHYEWMEKDMNWETGEPKRNWVALENGSSDHIKAFAASVGL